MAALFGRLRRQGRTLPALVAVAALVLASCTDYKARLRAVDAPAATPGATPGAAVVPPEPAEDKRSVWQGEKITGWVHLRFDVNEEGEVGCIEVVRSSDRRLEERAMGKLADWPFAPATRDGAPEPFAGMEMVMVFYKDDTTTTAEAIGITLLVIVLIPVAVLLSFASGGSSIQWGSN